MLDEIIRPLRFSLGKINNAILGSCSFFIVFPSKGVTLADKRKSLLDTGGDSSSHSDQYPIGKHYQQVGARHKVSFRKWTKI